MLWLLGRQVTSAPWANDRKPMVACCLDCALTVKRLWPAMWRDRMNVAVKTLRLWSKDKATTEQAQAARWTLREAWCAVAVAAADARAATLARCADIVREHFPKPPTIKGA